MFKKIFKQFFLALLMVLNVVNLFKTISRRDGKNEIIFSHVTAATIEIISFVSVKLDLYSKL